MNDNFLKNDELAKEILGRLREYAELPKKGFLAGGAVANTMLSIKWGGDYPINDLDIFQIESTGGLVSKNIQKMPIRHTAMHLFTFPYYGIQFGIGSLEVGRDYTRSYVVSKATRNGLLNLIDVQFAILSEDREKYRTILQGFDLNACEVGIDLENERLIYTADFESFLNAMELQVNYPVTPFHTAIRLPKKKKELNCYCNYDKEFRFLSQIPLLLGPKYHHFAKYFGEKYYELYLENQIELDSYFEVILSRKTTDCTLYTMNPRNSELIEELEGCDDVLSIKTKWKLLQGKKSVSDKNIKAWKLGWVPKYFLLVNPEYAQCDWHEKHVRKISEFVGQHPLMGFVFNLLNLNIQEQFHALRVINRMVNKESLHVIGLIEKRMEEYLHYKDESLLPPNNLISEQWIQSLVDAYLIKNSGPLKEPEDITDFEFSHNITELVTAKDLMSEGVTMHHCVGGYAGAVKDGSSIIFHIEAEGEGSTIEIQKSEREGTISEIYLAQHRGAWNKEPSSFHLMVGQKLFEYLKEKMGARGRDVDSLLAQLHEDRQCRQEQNVEEANNP